MGPPSHVFSSLQVGWVLRAAEVGLGFAVVGWFRRFRPPPPPLVWFRFRRPPLFFLALSGSARSGPGVFVLVFALSLFFCVLFFASWLSNFHPHFHFHLTFISFIFIFISSVRTLNFPTLLPEGVCVWNIWIDVKLLYNRGTRHSVTDPVQRS